MGRGQATANRTITVDGVVMGTSDGSGRFGIERSGFTAPADCTVDVNDGSATAATVRLSGCTVSSTSPPPSNPTPSTCTIVPETFTDGNVGTLNRWFFSTTGCRISEQPVRFNVVSGQAPPGLKLVSSGGIIGTPATEGLFTFTIQVQDQTGARDTESLSIRINAPRPVVITNQSDALSPATVGQLYCCGNLFADGGVPGYTWTLRLAPTRLATHSESGANHRHSLDPRDVLIRSTRHRHARGVRRADLLHHGDSPCPRANHHREL